MSHFFLAFPGILAALLLSAPICFPGWTYQDNLTYMDNVYHWKVADVEHGYNEWFPGTTNNVITSSTILLLHTINKIQLLDFASPLF